ncbi:ABC transporter ATP-binding protein [Streptomyces sp. NPDC048644]|uniref:ABC transporter ATP-binding protein n=1 Tax=Streptomyces sp. NPDC048644 TaxID=3365582 RepID=UPI003723C8D9
MKAHLRQALLRIPGLLGNGNGRGSPRQAEGPVELRPGAVAGAAALLVRRIRRRPNDPGDTGTSPADAAPPQRRVLARIAQRHKGKLALASALSVAAQVTEIMVYLLISWMLVVLFRGGMPMLSSLGLGSADAQLWTLAGAAALLRATVTALSYGAATSWRALGEKVAHEWRSAIHPHVQQLELGRLESERTTRIAGVLTEDVHQVGSFLATGPHEVLQLVACLLIMVPSYVLLAPQIAWVAILPVPLVVWLSLRHQKRSATGYAASADSKARLNSQVANSLEASATVKSFCTEEYEAARIRELSDDYRRGSHRTGRTAARYAQSVHVCAATSYMGTILLGGNTVLSGALALEVFNALVGLPQYVVWKLTTLGNTVEQYQRAVAAVDRVERLGKLPVEPDVNGRRLNARQVKGEVVIDRVTFSYPGCPPAVRDLSLRIPPGRTTGIVGATGAGKTTVAKLLMRFHAPQSGRVLLDQQDIRDLSLEDLRNTIGFVTQDAFLFDGTIRDNIRYGSFDAGHDAVVRSARMAAADEFIEALPARYDTLIGECGARLSGSQKQRIALARTFLKNPPILVLDEATSALDNETEAAVQRTLRGFAKGRTLIVIAHRLSTIRHADRIYVMDRNGFLAEKGTHHTLLERDGLYASLWRLQTGAIQHARHRRTPSRRRRDQ